METPSLHARLEPYCLDSLTLVEYMVERLSPVVILKAVAIAQRRMQLLEMRYRWSCAMIMVASFTAPRRLQWMRLDEWLTPLEGSGIMCGTTWSMADASHGKEMCMREDDIADWAILHLRRRHEGQFLLRQIHRRKKRLLRSAKIPFADRR